jgi:phosphoglycolate phosphatase-like HAD superfamily hydrolase
MASSTSHPPIIIFDVDGVLLDSRGQLLALLAGMNDSRYNWNYELLATFKSVDLIRRFESGAQRRSIKSLRVLLANFKELIPRMFLRLVYLYRMGKSIYKLDKLYSDFFPGTIETLRKLKNAGALIGAATNSGEERITSWFRIKEVDDIFENFVTRDDRKILGVKPSGRPLLGLLVKMKRFYKLGPIDKRRVVFVGDLGTDILAAKDAGVISVGVLSGHSTRSELEFFAPDYIVNGINELPLVLKHIFPNGSLKF